MRHKLFSVRIGTPVLTFTPPRLASERPHVDALSLICERRSPPRVARPWRALLPRPGGVMWSRPLAVALLLLSTPALAGAKEKVAALAPQALVLVVDGQGSELVAQNVGKPSSRRQLPRL